MRPLSPRESRLVAVLLLVAVVAVVWLGIAAPLIGGFQARSAERARLLKTFESNRRLVASVGVWSQAAQRQRADAGRFSLAAPTETLAAEAMKARLQKLAADEGYTITAIQDLAADSPPGQVRIRADAQLTLTQLCDSVRRLETEGAYVVVDFLSISADRALQSGRAAPLDIRLELSADYRPAPGRPS
jgi:general secretion pathway protein M